MQPNSFTPSVLLQALVQYNEKNDVIATKFRTAWLESANADVCMATISLIGVDWSHLIAMRINLLSNTAESSIFSTKLC